eukprot:RCo038774
MDRARPGLRLYQMPRGLLEQVEEQQEVEDRQALLTESWQHYCDRIPQSHEVQRVEDRQKWVTETWEDYEGRLGRRAANIAGFYRKLGQKERASAREAAVRAEHSEQCLADLKLVEARRASRRLPTLHHLLHDPVAEEEEFQKAARVLVLREEQDRRDAVECEELQISSLITEREMVTRRTLQAELTRREMERQQAERQQQEEARKALEAAEQERIRKEEEEKRLRQEEDRRIKEEQARKRKEVEDRRKAEAQRLKEERERLRREEEEEEERRRAQQSRVGT